MHYNNQPNNFNYYQGNGQNYYQNNSFDNNSNYEYNNIEIRRNKVQINKGLLLIVILILAYIMFLIIGISDTSYRENEFGKKEAVIVDLKAHNAREDYNSLMTHYVNLVNILEKCDEYEYEMANNLTPYFTLSTEYSNILDKIDSQMTLVKGMDIDVQYEALKTQMFNTYNYIAVYIQKMNIALLNDSYDTYMEAVTWKETAVESLENLRKNLITFGEDYAKIFNDKDLEHSRLYDDTQQNLEIFEVPTPTISTGFYGEENIKPTQTPTIDYGGNLGHSRLDNETKDTMEDNSNQDSNTKNDDGNITIDNPYSQTPTTNNNVMEDNQISPIQGNNSQLGAGRQ